MGQDDWFRSPLWGPEEEAHFEAKLARARAYNRPQYLRIKGLALAGSDEPNTHFAARELFQRVIALDDGRQADMAKSHLARWYDKAGDPKRAARIYRELMSNGGTESATRLAELIVRERWTDSYREAISLLSRRASDRIYPLRGERFRMLVAMARLYERTGDMVTSQAAAEEALGLLKLDREKPQFPRHPDIRLTTDDATVTEMESLADGTKPPRLSLRSKLLRRGRPQS